MNFRPTSVWIMETTTSMDESYEYSVPDDQMYNVWSNYPYTGSELGSSDIDVESEEKTTTTTQSTTTKIILPTKLTTTAEITLPTKTTTTLPIETSTITAKRYTPDPEVRIPKPWKQTTPIRC